MPASETLPNLLTVSENVWTLTLGTYSGSSVTSATFSDGTAALYLDSIRFESTNGGPTQLGEMAWESTDGSIDAQLENGVIAAFAEDGLIRVRNTSGVPIAKGDALRYTGTAGASGKLEVAKWVGANVSNAKTFMGFAACAMNHNTNGYAQWFGKLEGITTTGGGEAWIDGQIIYAVGGSSATITDTAPTVAGEYVVAAAVINAGSGTSGSLFIRPSFAKNIASADITDASYGGNGGADFGKVAAYDTSGNLAAQNLIALDSVSGSSVSATTGITANTGSFYVSLSAGSTLYVDGVTSCVGINNSSPSTTLDISGDLLATGTITANDLVLSPSSSITPANIGSLVIEATSNTSVTIKLRGSDDIVRSTVLTLS